MSKVRDISNLSNVIRTDASGNVSFVSGSTTLATLNTSGQLSGSSPVLSSSYALNADLLDGLDSTQFTLTSSFAAQTASFTAFTSSINTFTSSLNSFSASVLSYTSSLNAKTSSFATTGSNTFAGIQTINSNLTVTGSITAQTLIVSTINATQSYSSGSNIFGNASSNTQTFTGSMYVTGAFYVTTGSVGIGTTSPTNPLHILSNTVSQLNVAALSGNTNAQINLEPTGTGIALIGPANSVDFVFRTNAIERMRITSAGYVGIGTTSPSYTFDVSSSVAANFVSRILNLSSTGYGLYVQTNDNTKPGIRIANASGATAIDLFGSGTTTITGAPSLGNAHVICLSNSSGNTSYGGLEVQSSTGKAGYLTVGDNSNTGWYGAQASYVTLAGTAGAGLKFRVNADDTTGITIPTSGNVGISTSSPAQKLDVNGFIKNNGSYTGFGYVSANNGTAVTLFSTSANFGLYLVGADVPAGTGDINNYSAYAIIYNDGTTSKIMQQTNGGRFTISLSGNNVQGTQTSGGGPYNIRYVYQLLTGN
jgi:hypothetical protein